MTSQTNRQFLLAKRPVGAATRETFTYQEVPVGEPTAGQILVKNQYLSLDPAMRGWMNEGKSYIPPVGIGEVMRALGVGKVIASNNPGFAVGDYVNGAIGVQDYFLGEPRGFYKVDPKLAPLPVYLSALGMTGMTAYFDNVGGDILDAVLSRLNMKARVVICGAISQYNNKEAVKGPANYLSLLVNRARMEGFVVMDYAAQYASAAQEMAGWMAKGQLKSKEDIVEGLETFPETLMKLFSGENFGKLVLKV